MFENRFKLKGLTDLDSMQSSEQSPSMRTENYLSTPPSSGMGGLAETTSPNFSAVDTYYANKTAQEKTVFDQTQKERELKLSDRQNPWVVGGMATMKAIGDTASILSTIKLQNEQTKGYRYNLNAAKQFNNNATLRSKSFNAGYSAELNDNKRTI